jgi:hypothetical protein
MNPEMIADALASVRNSLSGATDDFESAVYSTGSHDPEDYKLLAENSLHSAFLKMLVLLDRLGLERTYSRLSAIYDEAQNEMLKVEMYDNDPYLHWRTVLLRFVEAVGSAQNVKAPSTISKDVHSILRACTHAITDPACFPDVPSREADVHVRIEAVLRCVFPDLKSKPALTKPIKNFQPDTGLPSIQTLIEYKFLSNAEDSARIADEILADTRGYWSPEWKQLIYAIYETRRFKTEHEWNVLLRECAVENASVVVLPGETTRARRTPRVAVGDPATSD